MKNFVTNANKSTLDNTVFIWLLMGVISLLICGLLSVYVVFLRVPYFSNIFSNTKDIFDLSLVVHVNLSIYVWFFSAMGIIYAISYSEVNMMRKSTMRSLMVEVIPYSEYYPITLLFFGTTLLIISAFVPDSYVIKVNYVPIINNLVFFVSIAMIGVSILTNSVFALIFWLEFKICTMAIILIIAFTGFFLAHWKLNENLALEEYYEYLFYGFGHLMQFAFSQLMMIIYLRVTSSETNRFVNAIFVLNVLFALLGLLIYCVYDSHSDIMYAFKVHMKIFSGIAPSIILLYIFITNSRTIFSNFGFFISAFLFFYGCILGFAAAGNNVSIPAHYHGSIVAFTIGIMIFMYDLLGIKDKKLTKIQIYVYALGQFMHITALARMGSYGALRKMAGMVAASDVLLQLFFIFGGITAIIGGAMFVINILKYVFWETRFCAIKFP